MLAFLTSAITVYVQRARKRAVDSQKRETATWKTSENHGKDIMVDKNAALYHCICSWTWAFQENRRLRVLKHFIPVKHHFVHQYVISFHLFVTSAGAGSASVKIKQLLIIVIFL